MPHPTRPVLIYDGKCGFCKIWIDYWRAITVDAVEYAASQDVRDQYPQIAPEAFSRSVHLVLPSGEVFSGARAVFGSLGMVPSRSWMLRLYLAVPAFAAVSEAAYRLIASHRDAGYWLTVILFGKSLRPARFEAVAWTFLRVLGAIFLVAFLSFATQAPALIGSKGVSPIWFYLDQVGQVLGSGAWQSAPSVFWLRASDASVTAVTVCGVACSLLVLLGVLWRLALFGAFVCYLSLLNASGEFLSYQWDILLLETGFLALFLGYSRVVVYLFRWLLFRLMFLSGAVKLLSGDPTWHNLSALAVHFQTQPIPTPLAWYAHQLPAAVLTFACGVVLFIELVVPFLVLGTRRMRMVAAPFLVALQIAILLTGNYAFFNWLTLALCLFLFDDKDLRKLLPGRLIGRAVAQGRFFVPARVRRSVAVSVSVVIGILSTLFVVHTLRGPLPPLARTVIAGVAPFGITSTYGLFASMTTTRLEIVVEGSSDGANWREYEFRYKPGNVARRPPWVAPHQPRLDWQMWFASLGSFRENLWFVHLVARLLQNDREVLSQLESNPFGGAPPGLVRASLYEYRFTDWNGRRSTGHWWTREHKGLYLPPVSLSDLSRLPLLQAEARRR